MIYSKNMLFAFDYPPSMVEMNAVLILPEITFEKSE